MDGLPCVIIIPFLFPFPHGKERKNQTKVGKLVVRNFFSGAESWEGIIIPMLTTVIGLLCTHALFLHPFLHGAAPPIVDLINNRFNYLFRTRELSNP